MILDINTLVFIVSMFVWNVLCFVIYVRLIKLHSDAVSSWPKLTFFGLRLDHLLVVIYRYLCFVFSLRFLKLSDSRLNILIVLNVAGGIVMLISIFLEVFLRSN
ncbi:hypothetical protein EDC56_3253 [Sinobacterium caligoides]|uniref:Uncharacterized protein n=1 Tax=Sinobacterium caligoides TaxID=933926 RepID=A0A3N2DGT4_9GAMM|nr:hypothetical protein EDC56_3253 [Sinobacterium caligoides]